MGGHSIKIIGWGYSPEFKVHYWTTVYVRILGAKTGVKMYSLEFKQVSVISMMWLTHASHS
jgi:hypothetical protein